MSTLAISADGLALIQQFEGYRAEPAQLPDGNWVVGHGHVRIGDAGEALDRHEAYALLALDLAPVERAVNDLVTIEITQQQFDALVSFVFSIGVEAFASSAVLRRVNAGHFISAGCAMDAWRKSDVTGESLVIDALVRRRAAEKALLLADAPVIATPSAFMRAQLDHAASILGAPFDFAAAPEVGSIPVIAPKPAPAQRLTEILMSEPATETLLLTQVVPEVVEEEADAAPEIVTAHAKPVARALDHARRAAIRNAEAQKQPKRFAFPDFAAIGKRAAENFGLIALMLFGLALVALGVSNLVGGRGDAIDLVGAAALATPGGAAALMSAYGLIKAPTLARSAR